VLPSTIDIRATQRFLGELLGRAKIENKLRASPSSRTA